MSIRDTSHNRPDREEEKQILHPGTYVISEVSTKVPVHRIEELLPLRRSEWQKIKDMIGQVKRPSSILQNIAFASAGAFPTALTFLIGLRFVQNVPIAVWILAWVMTIISPIVFLIAFIAGRKSSQATITSIEGVKAEMAYIEDQFQWPAKDDL
jgi:ABC-type bacteriocin/lantibiotic exporter with double-glycine peptidase domain